MWIIVFDILWGVEVLKSWSSGYVSGFIMCIDTEIKIAHICVPCRCVLYQIYYSSVYVAHYMMSIDTERLVLWICVSCINHCLWCWIPTFVFDAKWCSCFSYFNFMMCIVMDILSIRIFLSCPSNDVYMWGVWYIYHVPLLYFYIMHQP